jgi:poly(hydroxyalkanoate) depolymerase family esterase
MSLSISRFGLGLGLALVTLGSGCLATDDDLDSTEGKTTAGSSSDALTAVTGFGSNPGALKMYTYSPAGIGPDAPLVVAMHGCTQGAQEYVKAGWNQLADTWKFHVVYPEQQTANSSYRCFNWYEPGDTKRNEGEALSIKEMVDWAVTNLSVDPDRVYATGLSAGAAMTSVLLAVYPDVFAGGAILGGMPFKCAQSQGDMTKCMSPGVDKTPAAWGDLVRGAVPGYTGRLPKVSIWHGSSDTIVKPMNMKELMDQWTNVHGIDQAGDGTWNVSGATRTEYRNANGETMVETYSIPNMSHGTPVDPGYAPAGGCGSAGSYILDVNLCSTYQIGLFFGLDVGAPSGSSSSSASSSSSGSTSSSSSSSSSTTSSSSSSGTGGAGGAGGSGGTGGSGGAPPVTCEEFYDANYYHVTKGRAKQCGAFNSYVCTIGSNENLGLYNLQKTWVKKTAPGYYQAGQCQ